MNSQQSPCLSFLSLGTPGMHYYVQQPLSLNSCTVGSSAGLPFFVCSLEVQKQPRSEEDTKGSATDVMREEPCGLLHFVKVTSSSSEGASQEPVPHRESSPQNSRIHSSGMTSMWASWEVRAGPRFGLGGCDFLPSTQK